MPNIWINLIKITALLSTIIKYQSFFMAAYLAMSSAISGLTPPLRGGYPGFAPGTVFFLSILGSEASICLKNP